MHYLDTRELDRGLPGLAELCGGVAFLETFTREDGADGDEHDFQQSSGEVLSAALRQAWA